MGRVDVKSEIATVQRLEAELTGARRNVGRGLQHQRAALRLSLRAVNQKVKSNIATLSELERGRVWNTKLAARLARVYEQEAAKIAA